MSRLRLVDISLRVLEALLIAFAAAGVAAGLSYRLGDVNAASWAVLVAKSFSAGVMVSAAMIFVIRRLQDE